MTMLSTNWRSAERDDLCANLAADFTIALLGNYTTTLSATDFVL